MLTGTHPTGRLTGTGGWSRWPRPNRPRCPSGSPPRSTGPPATRSSAPSPSRCLRWTDLFFNFYIYQFFRAELILFVFLIYPLFFQFETFSNLKSFILPLYSIFISLWCYIFLKYCNKNTFFGNGNFIPFGRKWVNKMSFSEVYLI